MSSRPGDELPGDVSDDLDKFRQLRKRDRDGWDLGGLVEGAFATLTAIGGLVWFASMWWVPDTLTGTEWMGFGALIGVMFGLPAVAIYVLRRGGAQTIQTLIRAWITS